MKLYKIVAAVAGITLVTLFSGVQVSEYLLAQVRDSAQTAAEASRSTRDKADTNDFEAVDKKIQASTALEEALTSRSRLRDIAKGLVASVDLARPSAPRTVQSLKVAFIGDQGNTWATRAVLRMIKAQGADMVLHQGDFDYQDDPRGWDSRISKILGANFPYFASVGNHDLPRWRGRNGYQAMLKARLSRIPAARCSGDLGVMSACSYKGLFFILSGIGTLPAKTPDDRACSCGGILEQWFHVVVGRDLEQRLHVVGQRPLDIRHPEYGIDHVGELALVLLPEPKIAEGPAFPLQKFGRNARAVGRRHLDAMPRRRVVPSLEEMASFPVGRRHEDQPPAGDG